MRILISVAILALAERGGGAADRAAAWDPGGGERRGSRRAPARSRELTGRVGPSAVMESMLMEIFMVIFLLDRLVDDRYDVFFRKPVLRDWFYGSFVFIVDLAGEHR